MLLSISSKLWYHNTLMSNKSLAAQWASLPVSQMGLLGGSLCLDFVNTLAWRTSRQPDDRLKNVDELLAWSIYVGLLAPDEVRSIYPKSRQEKQIATQVVEEVLRLRE